VEAGETTMKNHKSAREPHTQSFAPVRSTLICATLLGAGWLIGSVATRPSLASAQVINAAPDQHFLSGDQLSLPILQDIAATLHQMDARLTHLEAISDRLSIERAAAVRKGL
jgi:hypothetical protein